MGWNPRFDVWRPFSAIAGIFIGHQIDGSSKKVAAMNEAAVFQINLMAILAHVAKVDGHVDRREIAVILSPLDLIVIRWRLFSGH